MRHSIILSALFILLGSCLAVTLRLSSQWERGLIKHPFLPELTRAQATTGSQESFTQSLNANKKNIITQRTHRKNGYLEADYNFINFNKDRLHMSFSYKEDQYKSYLSAYGYAEADLDILRKWHEKTRLKAWTEAIKKGGEAAGQAAVLSIDREYLTRRKEFFNARGFELLSDGLMTCNIPGIVKHNTAQLRPIALALQKIAVERDYGPEEIVGAALSMVQTALLYKVPPMIENGTHTGGILPPVRALLSGWGDCDTKTALLASILGNWSAMRLVGISVPEHYLMAIRRIPAKGDLFVNYDGLEYVLIEPAGPAWLEPGTVGPATAELLQGSEGYRIEKFF